jgi:hypothetical protein
MKLALKMIYYPINEKKYTLTRHTKVSDIIDEVYSRDYLRGIAKEIGVRRGRNKLDTIRNILDSNNIKLFISLEPKEDK